MEREIKIANDGRNFVRFGRSAYWVTWATNYGRAYVKVQPCPPAYGQRVADRLNLYSTHTDRFVGYATLY